MWSRKVAPCAAVIRGTRSRGSRAASHPYQSSPNRFASASASKLRLRIGDDLSHGPPLTSRTDVSASPRRQLATGMTAGPKRHGRPSGSRIRARADLNVTALTALADLLGAPGYKAPPGVVRAGLFCAFTISDSEHLTSCPWVSVGPARPVRTATVSTEAPVEGRRPSRRFSTNVSPMNQRNRTRTFAIEWKLKCQIYLTFPKKQVCSYRSGCRFESCRAHQ